MRRMLALCAALLLVVGSTSCASAGSGSTRVADGDPDRITGEQVRAAHVTTAYEAVRRLRPRFLRSRGMSSATTMERTFAVVYVDGSRYGELGTLRSIRAADVAEIRYLSGPDATTRFGTGHPGGVILVSTRSGG